MQKKSYPLQPHFLHYTKDDPRARAGLPRRAVCQTSADTFTIPFDRRGLADYLNLDRSALSKELGKMQKEGILEFHKTNLRCVIRLSRRYRNVNFYRFIVSNAYFFINEYTQKVFFRGYNHILFLLYPIFCTCKL